MGIAAQARADRPRASGQRFEPVDRRLRETPARTQDGARKIRMMRRVGEMLSFQGDRAGFACIQLQTRLRRLDDDAPSAALVTQFSYAPQRTVPALDCK